MSSMIILMKGELMLCAIIFLLLFLKLGKGFANETLLPLIQFLLLGNFIIGFFFNESGAAFGDMYYTDSMIVLQKNILNLAVYLISILFTGWFVKHDHLPEFFMLMLCAMLGMFFMISTNNLLMFYLSLELASIPVAAMANFDLQKRFSSEAAVKMILSSAFSSGILLFGISILYGVTGTVSFPEIAAAVDGSSLQIFCFVFVFTGFAFKLSVVPFHLWTADVYQGAPTATSAFLSVVSKGSITFVLITALYRIFSALDSTWYNLLVILSVATLVIGNLFALRQQDIKRFLAFSSIAQVGFILVGISGKSNAGISSVIFFVLVYVFSNLAAFAVAGVISSATGKEKISDLKGLHASNPFLSWMLALALFSLAGIPPTAGFFGKLFLVTAGASQANYGFIIFLALNLVVSLYYYLSVVRAMFMERNAEPIRRLAIPASTRLGLYICAAGIILIGLLSWVYDYIAAAVTS